jgi:hypothetical protein
VVAEEDAAQVNELDAMILVMLGIVIGFVLAQLTNRP